MRQMNKEERLPLLLVLTCRYRGSLPMSIRLALLIIFLLAENIAQTTTDFLRDLAGIF